MPVPTNLRDPRRPADEAQTAAPRWQRLLDAHLFDASFYELATGERFTSPEQAARHYIHHGQTHGIPPTPLLDVACLPRQVRAAWAEGKVAPLLRHLRSTTGLERSPSPLFAPPSATTPAVAAERAAHPGGSLGHFLESADPTTPLPVRDSFTGTAPTLVEARSTLAAHTRVALWHDLTGRDLGESEWHEHQKAFSRLSWDDTPLESSTEPLISLVCHVGHQPERARAGLAAAQAQDLTAWELLLVVTPNHHEADHTCAQLARDDHRVRVVHVDEPDAARAANAGVAAATAPLVACTTTADTWQPDYLRLAVTAMHGWGLVAAFGHLRVQEGRPSRRDQGVTTTHRADLGTLIVSRELALQHPVESTLLTWARQVLPGAVPHALWRCALPLAAHHRRSPHATPRATGPGDGDVLVARPEGLVDWEQQLRKLPHRAPDRVSIVTSTCDDFHTTVPAVRAALEHAGGHDIEAVVIDNGSSTEVGLRLVAAFMGDPRIRVVRLPGTVRKATAMNLAASLTTGSVLVVLDRATLPHPGWLEPLLAHLGDPGVRGAQSLLLNPDDTIASAGTIFWAEDHLPSPFLAGHPPEDARAAREAHFPAATSAVLALGAEEFVRLRGFDPHFEPGLVGVDLCLRAVQRAGGGFVVEPESRVTQVEPDADPQGATASPQAADGDRFLTRWRGQLPVERTDRYAPLGLEVSRVLTRDPGLLAPHPVVTRRPAEGDRQRLRWGIRTPSTPGPLGNRWGDTHLANSLSRALQQFGQDVVTYRRGAHAVASSQLDDVVVAIRGLQRTPPVPGKLNILWVISHPERVGVDELREYDLVYAASRFWAQRMTELSGRPVQALLQAVDSTKLADRSIPLGDGSTPVFVGATYEGRSRVIVHDALARGLDIAVHGPGWQGVIPESIVRSEYVENRDITYLYREHGLVLADHWPDMAAEGFIANRVFDAVASGALVISDPVPGLEMFDGVVQSYDSPQRLAYLCSPEGRAEFPSPVEVARVAERISRHETFAARARALLDNVTQALRSEPAPSGVTVGADL